MKSLRVWHWLVIGLALGLLIGVERRWAGPWYDSDVTDTLDATGFERLALERGDYPHDGLLREFHKGELPLRSVVVHPPLPGDAGANWVTGERYAVLSQRANPDDLHSKLVRTGQWVAFRFRAPIPYQPGRRGQHAYASVAEYLQSIQQRINPALAYREAWWERSPIDVLLPAGVGLFLGLLPPLLLWARSPKAAPERAAETRKRRAGANPPAGPKSPPASPPAPAVSVPPQQYGGEFYPVARSGSAERS